MTDASGGNPTCYGTGLVIVCVASPPTVDIVTSNNLDVDTDNVGSCATTIAGTMPASMCAIVATNIQISGNVTAHGSKPLVFVSTSGLAFSAPVDVASHAGGQLGAGRGTGSACDPGTAPGAADRGGAGGSFGTTGGHGGNTGGTPGAVKSSATLRGGCAGQPGGGTAPAGEGGGALALISTGSITINATINASGAGGSGASPNQGAGGGGSGGMIVLDAPMIMVKSNGKIIANGGGGGEGGGNGGQNGNPGQDPSGLGAAPGGTGGATTGGDGGNGSTGASVGANGNDASTGGGAGGGEGVVKVYPSQSLANTSPPPS